MPSGAYVVDLTPELVTQGTAVKRTVPLPPPGNTGVVKFGRVFLSLSANPVPAAPAAPTLPITITVFTQGGSVFVGNRNVGTARTGIGREIQAGDEAAFLEFNTNMPNQSVCAFVEYTTP
jgi:hypothetical protein